MKTVYRSDDGAVFDNAKDCLEHEHRTKCFDELSRCISAEYALYEVEKFLNMLHRYQKEVENCLVKIKAGKSHGRRKKN